MMFEEGEYYSPSDVFSCINSLSNSKKSKMMNKRRFSDDQVRSLESIFENETKLEPKKKMQVARELGLQPRQVAIWFQNKRARYKSKQLEKDYNTLRSNYNTLTKRFEDLKKERQALVLQLQKLKDEAEKDHSTSGATDSVESQQEDDEKVVSDQTNNNKRGECEAKPALSLEGSEYGGCSILSDEGSSENTDYFGMEEETDILTLVNQPVESSLTSQGWDDLRIRPDNLFDQPVDSCHWWDFWN